MHHSTDRITYNGIVTPVVFQGDLVSLCFKPLATPHPRIVYNFDMLQCIPLDYTSTMVEQVVHKF